MVRIREVHKLGKRGKNESVCVCVRVKGYNMEVAGKVTFES